MCIMEKVKRWGGKGAIKQKEQQGGHPEWKELGKSRDSGLLSVGEREWGRSQVPFGISKYFIPFPKAMGSVCSVLKQERATREI